MGLHVHATGSPAWGALAGFRAQGGWVLSPEASGSLVAVEIVHPLTFPAQNPLPSIRFADCVELWEAWLRSLPLPRARKGEVLVAGIPALLCAGDPATWASRGLGAA